MYRDPRTGLSYATKEAFRKIREQFSIENSNLGKKRSMGILSESISGQGFSGRRKRTKNSDNREACHFRSLARFRRIPALEIEDSE
ncbi:unnamed protein product [Ilex paraguariensis]|uniref:Vps72/YL1 C-terminal domain-containing protein n=1 Tax=Ilex paraguariensis TaxID=185542 RepID=A0ABC8V2Q0_9AQUA